MAIVVIVVGYLLATQRQEHVLADMPLTLKAMTTMRSNNRTVVVPLEQKLGCI
jgi:hypothetical protein